MSRSKIEEGSNDYDVDVDDHDDVNDEKWHAIPSRNWTRTITLQRNTCFVDLSDIPLPPWPLFYGEFYEWQFQQNPRERLTRRTLSPHSCMAPRVMCARKKYPSELIHSDALIIAGEWSGRWMEIVTMWLPTSCATHCSTTPGIKLKDPVIGSSSCYTPTRAV